MQNATLLLNGADLPFRLKVLKDPSHFARCDASVVYVSRSDYRTAAEVLEEIYPRVAVHLRQKTPAFTKPLAEGVGFAEDPGQWESFGLHRCRILADGMIRAYEQGKESIDDRLQVVARRFADDGIDIDKPFLNPGSADVYDFKPQSQRRPLVLGSADTSVRTTSSTEAFLRTAEEIGWRLSQQAVWHGDRCNWLGVVPKERSHINLQPAMTYSTLGPDLYGGTSGVALFLTELFAVTGTDPLRQTALGAMRQAFSRVGVLPQPNRLGLYAGWMGIALVAARVGTILGEEEMMERAAGLLELAMRETRDGHELDLLSGSAGAIAALVVLRDILEDESLLDLAIQLGDDLLRAASKTDVGYSWRSIASSSQRNLTGFSHGAAGVGYALLELFSVTRKREYLKAAEQAFQFERSWFKADAGNWPDLREDSIQDLRSDRPLSFATFWCHGAPGIALSRLRAYEVLKDETCKDEAITALRTTRKMIETSLHSGTENFSLCHGLSGNAEVLVYGCQVLEDGCVDGSALVSKVADSGIETSRTRKLPWPCGTGTGETPGVMLGLAGIGYFYLRLYHPDTPLILMLRREQFSSDQDRP